MSRTAFENSAQLLGVSAVVVLLADGARRVVTPHALNSWLVAALTCAIVLPVAIAGDDPLRSTRLALLPVSPRVLGRARVIASAPLRLPLAALLPILGGVPAYRVASLAAVLALLGWGIAAFFAGAALEERWHRPRAILPRVLATALATLGAWCLWSLRAAQPTAGSVSSSWLPTLLPRGGGVAEWLVAVAVVALSLTLGVVVLSARRVRTHTAAGEPLTGSARSAGQWRLFQSLSRASFPRMVRPLIAHEVALLARHVGPRVSLAIVAASACAATYGRVPGLALVAASPMIILAANALGADVPLSGLVRHRLQPESLVHLRDRRLTVWGAATALAALLGAAVGIALPTPSTAGQPTGGIFGAPAMLLYAASLVPWFGRATWWWARRYPQRFVQGLSDLGSPARMGPTGPAHLALGLLAAWAGVVLIAGMFWAVCQAGVQTALVGATVSQTSWLVATLLAAGVAGGAHVAFSGVWLRAARTRITMRVEAPS